MNPTFCRVFVLSPRLELDTTKWQFDCDEHAQKLASSMFGNMSQR